MIIFMIITMPYRAKVMAIGTVILAVHLAALNARLNQPLLIDEGYHFNQIQRFISGNWTLNPELSVVPGYHFVLFLLSRALNVSGLVSIKVLSFLISIISIPVFFKIAHSIDPKNAVVKTLQFSFLPVMFPFFSLLYSDIFSLTLVLLSLYLLQKNHTALSSIIGLVSIAVRQTNIVWFVFIYMLFYIKRYGLRISWSNLKAYLLRNVYAVAGLIIFLMFVYFNGGIVTGARSMQPAGFFSPVNIYFLLFLFTPLFLPSNLCYLPKILAFFEKHKLAIISAITVGCMFFLYTFNNSHPWNQYTFFLRNQLLILFTGSLSYKLLFYTVAVFSLLTLCVTRLLAKEYYLLYPAVVVSLAPLWLIEQRYYFIPLALFLLFRKANDNRIEYISTFYFLAVSLFLFEGMLRLRFFL